MEKEHAFSFSMPTEWKTGWINGDDVVTENENSFKSGES